MKKAVFLDHSTVGPDDLTMASLEDLPLSWTFYDSTTPEEVPVRISDAEIIVSNKCKLNAADIAQASELQYICAAATGFNHIDIEAADASGIAVSNGR